MSLARKRCFEFQLSIKNDVPRNFIFILKVCSTLFSHIQKMPMGPGIYIFRMVTRHNKKKEKDDRLINSDRR